MESSSIPSACRIASIAGLLELTKLGTMFDSVVTKDEFSEPREMPCLLCMMASGAAAGLLRLHACSPATIHRDIAMYNMFVSAEHQVKGSAMQCHRVAYWLYV